MVEKLVAYGLWPSPISPASVAEGKRLSDLAWDSDGDTLVWLEGRSDRGVLACSAGGSAPRDLAPTHSVRARVGYGGGDMTVALEHVYFMSEGRIWRLPLRGGVASPVTPAIGDSASPTVSPSGRWLVYVNSYEGDDCLAIVESDGSQWPQRLIEGSDFYMQPAWHPSGQRLAWISWDHPLMPWDGTRLEMARIAYDSAGALRIEETTTVVGDDQTAIFQPQFSPDGQYLAYVSDSTGWFNLYLHDLDTGSHELLVEVEAEMAPSAWAQGMRSYAWAPDSQHIHMVVRSGGLGALHSVDLATRRLEPVLPMAEYTHIPKLAVSSAGEVALFGSGSKTPLRLVTWDPATDRVTVRCHATSESIPDEAISVPEPTFWQSDDGEDVHGLLYLPVGQNGGAPGKPPLIVDVHGGPTSEARPGLEARVQFFTTRGYAVLQVNYRGSSGYGRAYRNKLDGMWGIYDADDAVSGARHIASLGLVDPDKLVVMAAAQVAMRSYSALCAIRDSLRLVSASMV